MNESSPTPSARFGDYEVYERLGHGRIATVHRAVKRGIEGFERACALKRLRPGVAEDAGFVSFLVREAKLAALLQHANIVQLYELGRVDATYFIAMEYVDGLDLRALLRRAGGGGPPPLGVSLSILTEMCDALDYAHRRRDDVTGAPLGIVHRDLAPSNLIVERSGHLKVIDFGIGDATAWGRTSGPATFPASSDASGPVAERPGARAYRAPEALSGGRINARSDVFSAGVIAYELLTAQGPFAADRPQRGPRGDRVAPPSLHNLDCPRALDAIVLRALARDPSDRWHTAAELREALGDVARRHKVAATSRRVAEWLGLAAGRSAAALRASTHGAGSRTAEPTAPVAMARESTSDAVNALAAPVPGRIATEPSSGAVADEAPAARARVVARPAGGVAHRTATLDAVTPTSPAYPPPAYASISPAASRAAPLEPTTPFPLHPTPAPDDPPSRGLARGTQPLLPVDPSATPVAASRRASYLRAAALGGVIGLAAAAAGFVAARPPPPAPVVVTPRTALRLDRQPDLHVTVDGAVVGDTVEVSPGAHRVVALGADYRTRVAELTVAANTIVEQRLHLAPVGDDPRATLTVRTDPERLDLAVDGQWLPQATPVAIQVAAGPHELVLRQGDTIVWRRVLDVDAHTDYELHAAP